MGQPIKSTTLLPRTTDSSTDLISGVDDEGFDIRWSRLRFVERQLLTQQFTGEHALTDQLRIDWRYAFSSALRDEPDRREYYRRSETPAGQPKDFQQPGRADANQRVWRALGDRIHDIRADVAHRFEPWAALEASAKVGATRMSRDRAVDTIRPTFKGNLPAEVRRQSPDEVFSDKYIGGAQGWLVDDVTQGTDATVAEQRLDAADFLTELPLMRSLDLMTGLRLENSAQTVDTLDPFSDAVPIAAKVENLDLLPATTATWRFTDDMRLRGGMAVRYRVPTSVSCRKRLFST
ncbi:MAG: TonB-dependent receptor [Polyangiaceae bacterium]|nr:TonB-dependent receptor [Polyangiaceae bacterium]